METPMLKQIALIGSTASGKTSLALELARRFGGIILSVDSLAIYRHIDIASAKPTKKERSLVPHYGIDLLDPDESFSAVRFCDLYLQVRQKALASQRPLIIVGGSSFYLKTLMDGMSPLPPISDETRNRVATLMRDLKSAYEILEKNAPEYAQLLDPADRYRIEKALEISFETGQDPQEYFRNHPPRSVLSEPLPLFEIEWDREALRKRIRSRTRTMLQQGLIDEVAGLEARYGRAPSSMKAIGIIEVLAYFDGYLTRSEMEEKITINTARLAKRQRTFNRSQFQDVFRGDIDSIRSEIVKQLSQVNP